MVFFFLKADTLFSRNLEKIGMKTSFLRPESYSFTVLNICPYLCFYTDCVDSTYPLSHCSWASVRRKPPIKQSTQKAIVIDMITATRGIDGGLRMDELSGMTTRVSDCSEVRGES